MCVGDRALTADLQKKNASVEGVAVFLNLCLIQEMRGPLDLVAGCLPVAAAPAWPPAGGACEQFSAADSAAACASHGFPLDAKRDVGEAPPAPPACSPQPQKGVDCPPGSGPQSPNPSWKGS